MHHLTKSIIGIVLLFAAPLCFGELVPSKLSCEYTSNPLGIDIVRPRLGWTFEQSKLRGQRQSAYQILVASSEEALKDGKADLWDSGKVAGDANFGVEYAGTNLTSGMGCWWKVRVWDEKDVPGAYSEAGRFEMGLLQPQDWKDAKWIAWRDEGRWKKEFDARKTKEQKRFPLKAEDPAVVLDPANGWNYPAGYQKHQKQPSQIAREFAATEWNIFAMQRFHEVPYDPAPLLRKEFDVDKPVRSARIYLSTPGYYELHVNGRRIGNQVLDPGWVDTKSRVLYVTHDVTAQLSKGANAIGIMLGRGFPGSLVRDRPGFWKSSQQPKMKVLLSIEYADGSRKDIVSGTDWKVTGGPVIFDDPYRGEIVDAGKEPAGWDTAGFDSQTWEAAKEAPAPAGAVVAQVLPPVRATEEIRPVSVANPEPGVYVFDFGKNIAGWIRLETSGTAGTEILVRYSELNAADRPLPRPGSFRTSYQQHGFILKGGGIETLEPRFCYAGFRYAVVSGVTKPLTADSVTALHIHTDMPNAGEFECSNELINEIHRAIRLTQLNLTQSITSDCPTRERKGWQNGWINSEMTILNFAATTFYEKWVNDIFDSASNNGNGLPYLYAPAPDVGSTIFEPLEHSSAFGLPWNLYLYYGDRRILETYYESMKRFVGLFDSKGRAAANEPHIVKGMWGDWLPPKEGQQKTAASIKGIPTGASQEGLNIYSTAYYFYCVSTFSKMAEALGKTEDAVKYRQLASDIQNAFEQKFYDPEYGCYRGEIRDITEYRQAADAVPLYVGLVPEERRQAIVGNLVKDLTERNDRLNTGMFATKPLMEVLPAYGQGEAAYRVASQTENPSWGYMLKSGLTTISEGWKVAGSLNHSCYIAAGVYFYKWLGGIQPDERHPGFRHFFLRPTFVKDLDFVRAKYQSPSGMIESSWTRKNGVLQWHVVVPANTTAEITIPAAEESIKEGRQPVRSVSGVKLLRSEDGSSVFAVSSGEYQFAWPCTDKAERPVSPKAKSASPGPRVNQTQTDAFHEGFARPAVTSRSQELVAFGRLLGAGEIRRHYEAGGPFR